MLNETFFLNGTNAKTVGILLQKPIEFSAPEPIVETVHIAGRNGDLVFETDAYANVKGEASCFALNGTNVVAEMGKINKFLSVAANSYQRLETSDDATHFRMARVSNLARLEQRMRRLNPFEITFDCKPQRFLKSGETATTFTAAGTMQNDYGFSATPFITVYGSGEGKLYVGSYTVSILDMTEKLYLDCENENAFNDNGNQNLNVNAPEFPKLVSGTNNISFSGGITKVEIIPRWWEL